MYFTQIFLILVLVTISKAFDCNLAIVSRNEWGAVGPKKEEIKPSAGKVFVHHTNTEECFNENDCIKSVKEIQHFHQNVLGNEDLDVHFLIGSDGSIYEGLGWDAHGLHAPEYPNNLGIAFIGVFDETPANQIMLDSFEDLIECGKENGKIDFFYSIYGHKDARCSTQCPGAYLYSQLKQMSAFQKGGKLEKSCDV